MVLLYTSKQYAVLWSISYVMLFMGRQSYLWGRQSYKSIAKFRETFILNQFTRKKSQPVIFLKKQASTTF